MLQRCVKNIRIKHICVKNIRVKNICVKNIRVKNGTNFYGTNMDKINSEFYTKIFLFRNSSNFQRG